MHNIVKTRKTAHAAKLREWKWSEWNFKRTEGKREIEGRRDRGFKGGSDIKLSLDNQQRKKNNKNACL
jgi:hypothetical protein